LTLVSPIVWLRGNRHFAGCRAARQKKPSLLQERHLARSERIARERRERDRDRKGEPVRSTAAAAMVGTTSEDDSCGRPSRVQY